MAKKKQEKEKEGLGAKVLEEKKYFEDSTLKIREKLDDLYDLYIGVLPESKHKSLSRNFVPKVHQAVETMASFLAGGNVEFFTSPEGDDDGQKAIFAQKWLEFVTRKVKVKPSVLGMTKSGLLFGVGVTKVVWDSDDKYPYVYNVNIGDLFVNPFVRDLCYSESPVIERLLLPIDYVEKKYGVKDLVPMGMSTDKNDSSMFDDEEIDSIDRGVEDRVEVLERWTLDKIVTVVVQPGKDKDGNRVKNGQVIREIPNKRKKIPYFTFRCAESPLPNRFYTIGLIEPNIRTQKRMNSLLNQIVDQTNIIMSPPAVIRRGSGINPRELVTFAGRGITAGDPARDISWLQIPDTTGSALNLYQILDTEFQRGTSVSSLRQGAGGSNSASEARISQANMDTVSNIIKENLENTIGEIGQEMLDLLVANKSSDTLRIYDPAEVFEFEVKTNMRPMDPTNPQQPLPMGENEVMDIKKVGRTFNLTKGDIDTSYDVTVRGDSTILQNKDVLRKQLQDWLTFISGAGKKVNFDKATEDWGLLAGIPNARKYIDSSPPPPPPPPKQEDQAKIVVAVADLIKAGAEVYPNQVQASLMGKWPLPQGQGNPIISPAAASHAQGLVDQAMQVGPGGGQSLQGPGQAGTSSGVNAQGMEQAVQPQDIGPLTQ